MGDIPTAGKRVVIIGAAGSVGGLLVDRFVEDGFKCYCIDTNETDLFYIQQQYGDSVEVYAGDYATTFMVGVDEWRNYPVVHAAAYKHVGFCEDHARAATHNNVNKFIRFLNEARIRNGVYISTDKSVEPRCIMGATKYLAERMALEAGWNAVRFGNVWGSRGSIGDTLERLVSTSRDGDEIVLPLRGASKTKRFLMRSGDVYDLIRTAMDYKGGPAVLVPSSLPEVPVRRLINDTFNELTSHYDKDIKLVLVDAPLNPGEKYAERFVWPEEEKALEDITPTVKAVRYAKQTEEQRAEG